MKNENKDLKKMVWIFGIVLSWELAVFVHPLFIVLTASLIILFYTSS